MSVGQNCPICGSQDKMNQTKDLYGTLVCRKCYYAFANRRQFAYFLDVLFFCGLLPIFLLIIASLAGAVQLGSFDAVKNNLILICSLFLPFKDGFSGKSIGKAIMGLTVVNTITGKPGNFGTSFLRNIPLLFPIVPIIVAFQLRKGKRWGDGWAHSMVIWQKYATNTVFSLENQFFNERPLVPASYSQHKTFEPELERSTLSNDKQPYHPPLDSPQMSKINNYYQILGLKPEASEKEILEAYKVLVKVWQSDRFSDDPNVQKIATEKIKEIDEALKQLLIGVASHHERRKEIPEPSLEPPVHVKIERPGKIGSIVVQTEPEGAVITINGEPVGISHYERWDLPPGLYKVRATLQGHEIWEHNVLIGAGAKQEVLAKLKLKEPKSGVQEPLYEPAKSEKEKTSTTAEVGHGGFQTTPFQKAGNPWLFWLAGIVAFFIIIIWVAQQTHPKIQQTVFTTEQSPNFHSAANQPSQIQPRSVPEKSIDEEINELNARLSVPSTQTSREITQNLDKREEFYNELTRLVPGWHRINVDPPFIIWLSQTDRGTLRTRQELLTETFNRYDANGVASFFREYISDVSRSGHPPNPDPALKDQGVEKITSLFENIRQANLDKNIDLFMSCFSRDFNGTEGKRRDTLKMWENYSYLDLSYDLKRQTVTSDGADVRLEWLAKTSQKSSGKIQDGKTVLDVILKREDGHWKIAEIKPVS